MVTVNIKGLLDIGKRISYSKEFGYSYYKSRSKSAKEGDVQIKIIEGEEAQFVNLFGIFVDLKSGNIALGMFPRADEYICIGNIKKLFAKTWFNSKKFPDAIDLKYVIELLKLDPIFYEDELVSEISDAFDITGSIEEKYNSVTLFYIKDKFKKYGGEDFEYFLRLVKKNKFILETVSSLMNVYLVQETIARDYYGAFLTEQYDQDFDKLKGMTIEEVLKAKEPNMESLTVRYLQYGFPVVFLNAMKSYGFAIKDRNQLFNKSKPKNMKNSNYSANEVIDIAIALSSMFYARNITKKELVLAYNFMDMLRAINWEQNILFALDSITELSSKVIWESLLKRFNIYEIMSEQNMSERELVLGVDGYRKDILSKIDWGVCYKRFASQNQYKMLSYAPGQIDTAGRIFEMTFQMVNKSLGI